MNLSTNPPLENSTPEQTPQLLNSSNEPVASLGEEEKRNPIARAVANEVARGTPSEEISVRLNVDEDVISDWYETSWFPELVLEMQVIMGMGLNERIEAISTVAFEKQTKLLLRSQNEGILERVSSNLLDRQLGRAPQHIEVKSTSLNITADVSQITKNIEQVTAQIEAMDEQRKKLEAR